jgi:ketosteroid isomerase-like protein
MSQENLDLVRHLNALGRARDWEAVFALIHEDIEWRDQMHAPDVPEVLHGSDAIRKLISQWEAVYDEFQAEVLEYIDADPWVICNTRWHGKGKGSGTPVEVHSVDAYEVKDGRITRSFGGYADLSSARKAIAEAS